VFINKTSNKKSKLIIRGAALGALRPLAPATAIQIIVIAMAEYEAQRSL